MKIIDAIILIEHINRELESAVLLKIELKKRGYSVELASVFWGFGKSLVKYRPKLVITPWAYDSREMNLILLFKGGYKDGSFFILNTHQEQVTYIDAQQFMIPRENARNCFHIAWGDFYRNLLLESGIKEETIRITGSPRLELFSKEYWVLSYSRNELAEEYKLDKDKKWILILGNFSFAFFSERKIESLYNRGNKASYDLKKEQLYVLSVITEWLDGLCEEYGDLFEIIYRPHPSERSYEKHKHLENNTCNINNMVFYVFF